MHRGLCITAVLLCFCIFEVKAQDFPAAVLGGQTASRPANVQVQGLGQTIQTKSSSYSDYAVYPSSNKISFNNSNSHMWG